jgi:hypothetical protein
LKRQLEELQKSHKQAIDLLQQKAQHNESLMLELQGFRETYQKNHEALRKDLSETSTYISRQISDVQQEVREGFDSQAKFLCQPSNDHVKDIKIQALQLEACQRSGNNS